jgi:ankyrin repeat protein
VISLVGQAKAYSFHGLTVASGVPGSGAMEGIWRAAGTGDLAEVQRLAGLDPGLLQAKDAFAYTPLTRASARGHVEVVQWLLDAGARVDAPGYLGRTALYLACEGSHAPVVELLVGRGADPTDTDHGEVSPLQIASGCEDSAVMRFILDHPDAEAMINHRDQYGRTPQWWACFYGRGGVVKLLLDKGADFAIADNRGATPLATAKRFCRRECVKALEVRCFSR